MGQVLTSCCDKSENHPKSLLQEARLLQISGDYNYFFRQDWFGVEKQLFDPEKYIFHYPNYKVDQETMERYWNKADVSIMRHGELVRQEGEVLNRKWQYLIRKGVPAKLSRNIILDIFRLTFVDCESEYLSAHKIVFKNKPIPKTFKHVPLFGCQTQEDDEEEYEYLNECEKKVQLILKLQILNKDGLSALIRLLWVINSLHHQLEYNPMLMHIIVMLLIYLTEAQTYCVLQFMIKDSKNTQNKQSLRWHLIMNEEQFQETALSCYETCAQRSSSFNLVYKKMQRLNFNYIELFQEMSISLMLTYLPFSVAMKVFILFLNEGIKIYFRFFYAILRFAKDEVLETQINSLIKSSIRKKLIAADLNDFTSLIRQAFKLRLNYADSVGQKPVKLSYIKHQTCYLPVPSHPTELITSEEFEIIWDWLPNIYKLGDPNRIFSNKVDGCSLKQLYLKCTKFKEYPLLFIIQSNNGIFGAFCDQMFEISPKYLGTNDSFIFQLHPIQKKYEPTNQNGDHLYCQSEYFSMGNGKNGPAIQIDGDLNKMYTNQCDTYNSPKLSEEPKLKCILIEVYYLN